MFVIGIAGGSGAGKTALVSLLVTRLPGHPVVAISQDNYYHDNSHVLPEFRKNINFDHPDAIDFPMLIRNIATLKKGAPVRQPIYSFTSCTRQPGFTTINPVELLVVEGILIFTNPALLKLFDFKIFIDTPKNERLQRILERDIRERGRSAAEVISRFTSQVQPMHEQYVEPSKKNADLLVQNIHSPEETAEMITQIVSRLYNNGTISHNKY